MKYISIEVNGVKALCVAKRDLSKMCGRKPSTLRKLEQRGVLPMANFRGESVVSSFGVFDGERLYTKELAEGLVEIFHSEIKQGVKISPEVQAKINKLFNDERQRFKL